MTAAELETQLPRAARPRIRQSTRERQATAGTAIGRVKAIASDPYPRDRCADRGGQPTCSPARRPAAAVPGLVPRCLRRVHPCLRSASATARALAEDTMWDIVSARPRERSRAMTGRGGPCRRTHPGPLDLLRARSPHRVSAGRSPRETARPRRSNEHKRWGCWRRPTRQPVGAYKRENVVGIDGKVFSSPVRTLERERLDKRTGELRPIREDPARRAIRRGRGRRDRVGHEVRHRLRPLAHGQPASDPRSRALHVQDPGRRRPGLHRPRSRPCRTRSMASRPSPLTGPGAALTSRRSRPATGCGVVTPARRLHRASAAASPSVGIAMPHNHSPGPTAAPSARRHAVGTSSGRALAPSSSRSSTSRATASTSNCIATRRSATSLSTRTDGQAHQFYAKYSLACPRTDQTHTWWEPLLPDRVRRGQQVQPLRVPAHRPRDVGGAPASVRHAPGHREPQRATRAGVLRPATTSVGRAQPDRRRALCGAGRERLGALCCIEVSGRCNACR